MKPSATPKPSGTPGPTVERIGHAARALEILGAEKEVSPAPKRIPAKWRWHHRVLLSLQSRLLQKRGDLRQVVAEPLEPHSLDEADSATDEFDHDLALTQLSAEQDALYEVNEALGRIRNGTYGVCEETGKPIPAARLKAVPWTRFTREAEERLEQEGGGPHAGLSQTATVRAGGRLRLSPEEEAEEVEEAPSAPPKDEALSSVFSPPGRHVPRRGKRSRRPAAKRQKG
jgi:RNA polymerase-binding transcription factor DksA